MKRSNVSPKRIYLQGWRGRWFWLSCKVVDTHVASPLLVVVCSTTATSIARLIATWRRGSGECSVSMARAIALMARSVSRRWKEKLLGDYSPMPCHKRTGIEWKSLSFFSNIWHDVICAFGIFKFYNTWKICNFD